MSDRFSIPIDSVVELLHLKRDPRNSRMSTTYNVRCPFCGDHGYHMNIDPVKNVYNCVICPGDKTGGGALDLFGRVALGQELIPKKNGSNGNGSYLYRKLSEALGMQLDLPAYKTETPDEQTHETVAYVRASDDSLNRAYTALLDFAPFALTKEHHDNLIGRGLDEESIIRNGYRSFPETFEWVHRFPQYIKEYRKIGLDAECRKHEKLRKHSEFQRIAGFVLASELGANGVSMCGVPGFFKIKGHWMFIMEPGLAIPTRNINGEIVGIQVRKSSGSLRYMTLSSKGLPEGVTEGISRIHFPLANKPLKKGTTVLITEGPLKADVSACLIDEDAFFAAVQGVSNRSDLPELFSHLRKCGFDEIYNAFDMDKVTNPHVSAAGRRLRRLANAAGVKVNMRLWDEECAWQKYMELSSLCMRNHVRIEHHEPFDVFSEVCQMSKALFEKGIEYGMTLDSHGNKKKDYWNDATKGIDDFLLLQRKNKQSKRGG